MITQLLSSPQLARWIRPKPEQMAHSRVLHVENICDRNDVGSLKVNDNSSQLYEPGANRNW